MANFNKVYLIGNLTRDVELRVTPRGTAIGQFGLAVNREWKNDAGEKQSETTFVDVEAWGKQAETLAKYVTKGRPLFVEGRLKLDSWEDKASGQKRSKIKVVLEGFQFLGGRQDEAPSRDAAPPADAPTPTRAAKPAQTENLDDPVDF